MSYSIFKSSVLGKRIGDGECVSLIVNNSQAYVEYIFPGINWTTIIKPVTGAKDLLGATNTKYFQIIKNDHANASQLPQQGDVMVFDATPKAGYTNTFNNPWGHTGICEKADSTGYWLLQQNSPSSGSPVNVTYYPWKYRPCLGWMRPIKQAVTPPKEVNMPTLTTKADLDFLYPVYLGRARKGNEGEDVYLNKDYKFVSVDLYNSKAGQAYRQEIPNQLKDLQNQLTAQSKTLSTLQASLNAKQDELTKADDDNANLKTQLASQTSQLDANDKVIKSLSSQNKALQAQIQSSNRDSNQLNALGQALKWLIEKLGLRNNT